MKTLNEGKNSSKKNTIYALKEKHILIKVEDIEMYRWWIVQAQRHLRGNGIKMSIVAHWYPGTFLLFRLKTGNVAEIDEKRMLELGGVSGGVLALDLLRISMTL